MKRYIMMLIHVLVVLSACENESLEDTYKEYAGNGEIRYIGKCTDVRVKSGWNKIVVNWKNNEDPTIKVVKVTWAVGENKDSVLLKRGTTEYDIVSMKGEELRNINYEIRLYGVDTATGSTSISTPPVMGRPYTYEHEDVLTFNKVISNAYILDHRLVLSLFEWQDNMKEAIFKYTREDGTPGEFQLTEEICNKLYLLLQDPIDPAKPLVLCRKGVLEDALISFKPDTLFTDKVYESDFQIEMNRQFGFEDIPVGWVNQQTTLYLDWSISSFRDLLNFPKLNKLILGKHRYLVGDAKNDPINGQSAVSDVTTSDFVLNVLHELNGLTVERYNNHFSGLRDEEYIIDQENSPEEPKVTYVDMSGLEFAESPKPLDGYPTNLFALTDNDFSTGWQPKTSTTYNSYELTLDLKSPVQMKGIRLVQRQWSTYMPDYIAFSPNHVKIKVSKDGKNWERATYVDEYPLGKSDGEINFIPFTDKVHGETYRYIQLEVNPGVYYSDYCTSIAEITPYY